MLTHIGNVLFLYSYLKRNSFEEESTNVGYSHLLLNVIKVNILKSYARILEKIFALKDTTSKCMVPDNLMHEYFQNFRNKNYFL